MTFFSLPVRQDKVSDHRTARTYVSGLPLARLLRTAVQLMAGRTEARIFTSIWRDPHFTGIDPGAQWLYMLTG